MNILLSGSGSGGHIYPCIATYNNLKKDNNCIIVIFKEIDKKIYELNNIKYIYIDDNLSTFKKLKKINKIYKEKSIDISLTFGGKNSLFINLITKLNKGKSFIFEQNAIMGKANKLNYILANKVFTTFKLNKKKEVNIGNPNTFDIKDKKIKLFNNNKLTILITLGSLGSSSVNKVIKQFINNCDDFNIIYVLGNNVIENFIKKDNVKIYPYYNPLVDLINNVDLIISRAGASTLSEIIKLNKPSIIIPSPYVTNNHQEKNANNLYLKGCIDLIYEKNLNLFILKNKVYKLLLNKNNYNTMVNNIKNNSNNYSFADLKKELFNEII